MSVPVYEPVAIVDSIDPSRDPEPWLASKIEWSEDYKTVKLTARDGVKWADGKDFTADDIAYTYQLFKDHPELDLNAIGVAGTSVDGNVATVEFEKPMFVKQGLVLTKPICRQARMGEDCRSDRSGHRINGYWPIRT